MKQTAVEFLVEQLIPKAMVEYDTTTYNAINKAKEMEKEQIINAWNNSLTKGDFNSALEYYNENFKSE